MEVLSMYTYYYYYYYYYYYETCVQKIGLAETIKGKKEQAGCHSWLEI